MGVERNLNDYVNKFIPCELSGQGGYYKFKTSEQPVANFIEQTFKEQSISETANNKFTKPTTDKAYSREGLDWGGDKNIVNAGGWKEHEIIITAALYEHLMSQMQGKPKAV